LDGTEPAQGEMMNRLRRMSPFSGQHSRGYWKDMTEID
jgi:hypothetical protein